jgi:hypothetical protein
MALLSLSVAMASAAPPPSPEPTRSAAPLEELTLVRALVVEGSAELDLSGLHWIGGRLLTVSDKVGNTVYEIQFSPGSEMARLKTHRTFTPPPSPSGILDWEALQSGPDGSLYLASEKNGRIARLSPKARKATWLTPPTRTGGLEDSSAGLEGLAFLGENHFLLAKEREPSGLIEWRSAVKSDPAFIWHPLAFTHLNLPPERHSDIADLHREGERIYALARNAEAIVELERKDQGWKEGHAWSFSQAVRDPRHAYLAQKYGQAEGLTMNAEQIYLVIDNNRSGRVADPKDRRATLFIFQRPNELGRP